MSALTSATAIRAGVVALREARAALTWEGDTPYEVQQRDEQKGALRALDAVLRLIDTGHWRVVPEPLGGGVEAVRDGAPIAAPDHLVGHLLGLAGVRPEDVPDERADLDAKTAAALRRADPPTVVVPLGRLTHFDPVEREHPVTGAVGPSDVVLVRTDPDESTPIAEGVHGLRSIDRQYDRRRKRGAYDPACDACIRGDGVVRHTCEDAPRLHGGG